MSILDIPDFVNNDIPSVELENLMEYYRRMYNNYYVRLLQQFDNFNSRISDLENFHNIGPRESHVYVYIKKDLTLQASTLHRLLKLNQNDNTRVNSYLRNKILQVMYENTQLRYLIGCQRSRINQLQEMEPLLSDEEGSYY